MNHEKARIKTVEARIEATIRNAIELSEWESQLPGQMVPVIQGYTLRQYLYCLRSHKEAGTLREYMAVGSMCQRSSDQELSDLVPGITYAAQRMGVFKLHFFGLKLTKTVQIYDDMIWSRDSAVSLASSPYSWRKLHGGRRFPIGQVEKEEVFNLFLDKLTRLGLNYCS